MGLASRITGKPTVRKVEEDDSNGLTPPQMAPSAALRDRQKKLLLQQKKKGVKESLIPSNADRISGTTALKTPDNSEKSENDPDMPELPGPDGMFPVATALIAPDVMPDLFKPLSPSKIPSARPADGSRFDAPGEPEVSNPPGESAMDTLLNRDQEDAPAPSTSAVIPNTESVKAMLRSMGAAAEDLPVTVPKVERGAPLAETLYTPKEPVMGDPTRVFVAEGGTSLLRSGEKMPEPGVTDPSKTVSLFRDFIRP